MVSVLKIFCISQLQEYYEVHSEAFVYGEENRRYRLSQRETGSSFQRRGEAYGKARSIQL